MVGAELEVTMSSQIAAYRENYALVLSCLVEVTIWESLVSVSEVPCKLYGIGILCKHHVSTM